MNQWVKEVINDSTRRSFCYRKLEEKLQKGMIDFKPIYPGKRDEEAKKIKELLDVF